MNDKIEIRHWPINKLKPHQWQNETFFEHTAAEFAALLQSIKTNGILDALEVTPDGAV